MRRIFLLPLLTVALVGLAKGQGTDRNDAKSDEEIKKELLKFEDERNAAILKHDTAVLDRMYADGIVWIMSNGDLLTKAQVLANIGSGNQLLSSIQHSDRHLHVYGNTVVLTAQSVSRERYKGKDVTIPRRFTNVYVKRNGQWMVVSHSVTFIVKE